MKGLVSTIDIRPQTFRFVLAIEPLFLLVSVMSPRVLPSPSASITATRLQKKPVGRA